MSDRPNLSETPIFLVRLASGAPRGQFEAALSRELIARRQDPLVGSIAAPLAGNWFALSQSLLEVLSAVCGSPGKVIELLVSAGALEARSMSFDEFRALLNARPPAELAAPVPNVAVEPPVFGGMTVSGLAHQGALDWHLVAPQIPLAWQRMAGRGNVPDTSHFEGIRVGHIDTGYTEHPALGFGRVRQWILVKEGLNLFADTVSTMDPGPYDFARQPEFPGPRDNLTGPFHGHGTRTMSLIAARYGIDENVPLHSFFGAAPGVPVVPYRITDSVLIDAVPKQLAAAIQDAVSKKECSVISISLGAVRPDAAVRHAVDRAYENGVIVCAAAGNVISEVIYPGRFNRVVTVGGLTSDDGRTLQPWLGGSRGIYVDISGPADGIRRATTILHAGAPAYSVGGQGNGTSFATAICAGVACLWLAHRKNDLSAAYTQPWQRVAAFKRLLKETAIVPAQWDDFRQNYGAGCFNADALLAAPLPSADSLHKEAPAGDPFDPKA